MFVGFFELYSILTEKQRTKKPDFSFLSLQDTIRGELVVKWKKLCAEILVWAWVLNLRNLLCSSKFECTEVHILAASTMA